jgi:hypothetical protein
MKTQDFAKSEAQAVAAARSFAPVTNPLPVVLNSLPKSGTVLLRNILMSFYGVDATRARTIDWNDVEGYKTFSEICSPDHRLLVGHLAHNPFPRYFVRSLPHAPRMILLIRHPLDNCYSLARHYFRPGQADWDRISEAITERKIPFDEVVTYCITGISYAGEKIYNVLDRYTHVLAWQAASFPTLIVRYERLIEAIRLMEAERANVPVFEGLFSFCGITPPPDWRRRIVEMAQPSRTWTHVSHESEEERYPNRGEFLAFMNSLYPGLLQFAGYER